MKNKRANKAVSEVVGTAMLLGMAVALFALVQIIAMSVPFNPHPPSVRLVGYTDGDWVYITHHGGESLESDTRLLFTIDGDANESNVGTLLPLSNSSNGDTVWNIGETLGYNHTSDLSGLSVNIAIVDIKSNEIIMMSTLQE